jgi:predicted nucleic acid-binding protein
VFILDLTIYELVNILIRRLKKSETEVERAVRALFALGSIICRVDEPLAREAARIAGTAGLTGYDAAYVAASVGLGIPLITADRQIITSSAGGEVLDLSLL